MDLYILENLYLSNLSKDNSKVTSSEDVEAQRDDEELKVTILTNEKTCIGHLRY